MTLTPERLAELRQAPSYLTTGEAIELLDEIDRLRAVIRETHATYCAGEPRYAAGKLHAPECLIREIGP